MKKSFINSFVLMLGIMFPLASCQDNTAYLDEGQQAPCPAKNNHEGMQRIVVSSSLEIENIISRMGDGTVPMTRALSSTNFSGGDASFVSLFEANRAKVMDSLTPEQLDSIVNDEDELEFCPADSVIADMQFAQLLNAEREIQVGQTVYRYMPNGVASTSEEHAGELKAASSLASGLQVTPENVGTTVKLTPNVDFTLVPYEPQMFSDEYLYGRGPGTYGRYPGNGSGGGNTSDGNSGNTSGSGSD